MDGHVEIFRLHPGNGGFDDDGLRRLIDVHSELPFVIVRRGRRGRRLLIYLTNGDISRGRFRQLFRDVGRPREPLEE